LSSCEKLSKPEYHSTKINPTQKIVSALHSS